MGHQDYLALRGVAQPIHQDGAGQEAQFNVLVEKLKTQQAAGRQVYSQALKNKEVVSKHPGQRAKFANVTKEVTASYSKEDCLAHLKAIAKALGAKV